MTGVRQVGCKELAEELKGEAPPQLLDVRQPEEFEVVHLEGAVLVTQEVVDDMLKNWPKDTPIVTYCHHGMRSMDAAHWLAQQGFADVRSLTGGVDAWAVEIDPSLARY